MNFDENLADFGCGLEEESSMSKSAAAFLKSYARTCNVMNAINELEAIEKKHELVRNYLDFCYDCQNGKLNKAINPVSISMKLPDLESINSASLPDLHRDSISTLYLVEFFTHCCINCIHSIEDVRQVHEQLEKKFESMKGTGNGFGGIKVLSVHSPKFPREKDVASIKAFCKRNRMDHSEVVNDPNCLLWNEFGVTCWPTLLILGPNPEGNGPNLLFNFMGEGHKKDLEIILNTALEYFNNNLKVDLSIISYGIDKVDGIIKKSELNQSVPETKSILKFPGKVAAYGDYVVISDSGNNRLIFARSNGKIIDIIGGTEKGCKDGTFEEARFYNPQGIAFKDQSVFFVADTGNHAIRIVDLTVKHVFTYINPGREFTVDEQSDTLKSPWDLMFYDSEDILMIAAAGNHRLFGYFFSDVELFGIKHDEATFAAIAGSGREENRNNSYIMKASFAQPSGICLVTGANKEKQIFIADSESSSIRSINSKGQVVAVVGGSRDPTDLFAFGDADGKGVFAKLQHPMGVCPGVNSSHIFVADTYNHKIKKIDLATKECVTVVASGLNEPSGICKDPKGDRLYVADTNNHSIKVLDIPTGNMSEMELYEAEKCIFQRVPPTLEKFDKTFDLSLQNECNSIKLNFLLSPLPDSFEGGSWRVLSDAPLNFDFSNGRVEKRVDENVGYFSFCVGNMGSVGNVTEFYVLADVFFCNTNSCRKVTRRIKVTSSKDEEAPGELEKTLEWSAMTWDD